MDTAELVDIRTYAPAADLVRYRQEYGYRKVIRLVASNNMAISGRGRPAWADRKW